MDLADAGALLERQSGVISRRQLQAAGAAKHDIDRMVRRRELARIHPGVYADHTGPLTWLQRAWAAVLYAEPAALCLLSALGPAESGAWIDVAVDETRRVAWQPGIRVHRVRGLGSRVLWNLGPPRVRIEDTVLELAHRADSELEVIRLLTKATGERRTNAARLRGALVVRQRMRRRSWVARLLDDIESGTCSVLEHRYLTHVERAHGLPRATRQRARRSPSGPEYRDVEYEEFGLVVELDGRAGHDTWPRLSAPSQVSAEDPAHQVRRIFRVLPS